MICIEILYYFKLFPYLISPFLFPSNSIPFFIKLFTSSELKKNNKISFQHTRHLKHVKKLSSVTHNFKHKKPLSFAEWLQWGRMQGNERLMTFGLKISLACGVFGSGAWPEMVFFFFFFCSFEFLAVPLSDLCSYNRICVIEYIYVNLTYTSPINPHVIMNWSVSSWIRTRS